MSGHRHALAEVSRAARRRGWTVTQTRRHHRLVHEHSGAVVLCSLTPSDRNATKRIEADLRRAETAPIPARPTTERTRP